MTYIKFTVILICLTSITAFAQDEVTAIGKGNWIVGGNLSLSTPLGSEMSLLINPKASYFVGKKLSLGLSLNYQYQKNSSANQQFMGIGPSVRYYFKNSRLAPFAELEYNFSMDKNKGVSYYEEGWTTAGSNFGLGAGLNYFITKNIALEGVLKYNFIDPFTYNFHDVFNDGTFNLNVGFQFFISRKK